MLKAINKILIQKTDQIFFINFSLWKNDKKILSKTQKKTPKKSPERYQNLPEEEKDENNMIHGLDLKI